jgi:CHAT domain-containing protein
MGKIKAPSRRRFPGRAALSIVLLAAAGTLLLRYGRPGVRIASLSEMAEAHFRSGDLNAALREAELGIERSGTETARVWQFRVLQAEILLDQDHHREAAALLAEEPPSSLANSEIAVRRKIAQARAAAWAHEFVRAESLLSEAEKLPAGSEAPMQASLALSRGLLAILHHDPAGAEPHLRRAVRLGRRPEDDHLAARAMLGLGWVSNVRGRYGEAIEWFEASRKISEPAKYSLLSIRAAGDESFSFYMLGDLDSALALCTQADARAARLGLDGERPFILSNIGLIHHDEGDYAAALAEYRQALAMARNLRDDDVVGACLNNLAEVALESGQLEAAEQYNQEALKLKRARHDRPSELYSLQNEARIRAARGDFAGAEKVFREVIAGSGANQFLQWQTQARLAQMYVRGKRPQPAQEAFLSAIHTVDRARLAEKEEFRISFLSSAREFYNDYVEFLMARRQPREALRIAEHSRARTLLEGLGKCRSEPPAARPASPAPPARAHQDVLSLCASVAGGSGEFQPERIARSLNSVILFYWLKPERSYLWAVTPRDTSVFVLPPEGEINVAIQAYQKVLQSLHDASEGANPDGLRLYVMLVAPVRKLIPPGAQVAIIADGVLNALNFETLLVPGPGIHYWIEDVVVRNASSMAMLAGAPQRRPVAAPDNLLIIGDPVQPTEAFPELPQARAEIERVAHYFRQSVRITRAQAVPRAYAENHPGEFSYIHFATHATSSRTSPLDSSIVLSREGETYQLFARQIVEQPLRARLVTISACRSAGTRAYAGEGLVGLSWAFLRAGAHAVIGALWEVNDTSTPQLMDALYRNLAQGEEPAEALRHAKLSLLRSKSPWALPLFWAGFQIYVGG